MTRRHFAQLLTSIFLSPFIPKSTSDGATLARTMHVTGIAAEQRIPRHGDSHPTNGTWTLESMSVRECQGSMIYACDFCFVNVLNVSV